MKTIAVINLKGGVAKTTTAANMATLLGTKYQKNVLLIDNDPQGNASQFFDCYRKDEKCGAAKILDRERPGIFTDVAAGVDLINANMTLLEADNELRTSEDRQDNRFAEYMEKAASIYDYCIIDNPPAILMCTINALCAADEVIIPAPAGADCSRPSPRPKPSCPARRPAALDSRPPVPAHRRAAVGCRKAALRFGPLSAVHQV